MTARKPASISKPQLAAGTISFIAGAPKPSGAGASLPKEKKTAPRASKVVSSNSARVFFAPEGDKRLTINMREDLHKRLKIAAIEQGSTVGEILEKLVEEYL